MGEFNKDDPKYKSCCCRIHVTEMAQILIFLDVLIFFIAFVYEKNLLYLINVPILALGIYAVTKQKRTPLLIYMCINIAVSILAMIGQLLTTAEEVAAHPNDKDYKYAYECEAFGCFVGGLVEFFICKVYWNFAKYIKDRERSQKRVIIAVETPTRGDIRSAPPVQAHHEASTTDAPPPYEEKA